MRREQLTRVRGWPPALSRVAALQKNDTSATSLPPKNWFPISSGMHIFVDFRSEFFMTYPVTPKLNRASFNGSEATNPLGQTIQ